MDFKKMKKIVCENIHLLDESDINKLYLKVICSKTSKLLRGLYISAENGHVSVVQDSGKNVYVNAEETPEQNAKRIMQIIRKQGVDLTEFYTYKEFSYLLGSRSSGLWRTFEDEYRFDGVSPVMLIRFMLLIIDNNDDVPYEDAEKILKDAGAKTYQPGAFKINFPSGVTIQTYKNGKFVVKGLTPEQRKRFDRFLTIGKIFK